MVVASSPHRHHHSADVGPGPGSDFNALISMEAVDEALVLDGFAGSAPSASRPCPGGDPLHVRRTGPHGPRRPAGQPGVVPARASTGPPSSPPTSSPSPASTTWPCSTRPTPTTAGSTCSTGSTPRSSCADRGDLDGPARIGWWRGRRPMEATVVNHPSRPSTNTPRRISVDLRALSRLVRPVPQRAPELVETASYLFDDVVVGAIRNPQKGDGLFSLEERQAMIMESLAHLDNVRVVSLSKLVVEVAKDVGADVIVKGLPGRLRRRERDPAGPDEPGHLRHPHHLHPVGVGQLVPGQQADPGDRPLRRRRLRHGPGAGGQAADRKQLGDRPMSDRGGYDDDPAGDDSFDEPDEQAVARAPATGTATAPTTPSTWSSGSSTRSAGARPDAAVVVGDDQQPRRGRGAARGGHRPLPRRARGGPLAARRSERSSSPRSAGRARTSSTQPGARAERMVQRTEVVKRGRRPRPPDRRPGRGPGPPHAPRSARTSATRSWPASRSSLERTQKLGGRRAGQAPGQPAHRRAAGGRRRERRRPRQRRVPSPGATTTTAPTCRPPVFDQDLSVAAFRGPSSSGIAEQRRTPGPDAAVAVAGALPGLGHRPTPRCPTTPTSSPRSTSELLVDGATLTARGTISAPWTGRCRRCSQDVAGAIEVEVSEVFEPPPRRGRRDLPARRRPGRSWSRWSRDAVLLALPLRPAVPATTALAPIPTTQPRSSVEGDVRRRRPPDRPRWAALGELRFDGPERAPPPTCSGFPPRRNEGAMAVPKKKTSKAKTRSRRASAWTLGTPGAFRVPLARAGEGSPHRLRHLRLVQGPPGHRRRLSPDCDAAPRRRRRHGRRRAPDAIVAGAQAPPPSSACPSCWSAGPRCWAPTTASRSSRPPRSSRWTTSRPRRSATRRTRSLNVAAERGARRQGLGHGLGRQHRGDDGLGAAAHGADQGRGPAGHRHPDPASPAGGCLTTMLDAGANADCTAAWLVQFAQMGAVFARHRFGIAAPDRRPAVDRRGAVEGQRAGEGDPRAPGRRRRRRPGRRRRHLRRQRRGPRPHDRRRRRRRDRRLHRQRRPQDASRAA